MYSIVHIEMVLESTSKSYYHLLFQKFKPQLTVWPALTQTETDRPNCVNVHKIAFYTDNRTGSFTLKKSDGANLACGTSYSPVKYF